MSLYPAVILIAVLFGSLEGVHNYRKWIRSGRRIWFASFLRPYPMFELAALGAVAYYTYVALSPLTLPVYFAIVIGAPLGVLNILIGASARRAESAGASD